jgi:DNA-binding CsgD family transcriptional regulator
LRGELSPRQRSAGRRGGNGGIGGTDGGGAPTGGETPVALITHGADLVHVVEELFLRLFRLALVFVLVGSVLSVWFAEGGRQSTDAPLALTIAIAALGAAFGVGGLLRPRELYCWLRYSGVRQLAPAAAGALAVLVNGPDSPSWWLALALLLLVSSLSSIRLSVAAAVVTAAAFLLGTAIRGHRVIGADDAGVLAGTVGLIAYTVVGAYVSQAFGRFVLGLHRLQRDVISASAATPRQVRNLAPTPGVVEVPYAYRQKRQTPPRPKRPGDRDRSSRLTPRQLEAALLARDGLKQPEIAITLGISPRQVERLLTEARERAGAATTSQLVALLVTDGLAPDDEANEANSPN